MATETKEPREKKGHKIETSTISQTVIIPAKPVEVYDAILNPRKHALFTGARATCKRRIGGTFTAWNGYISGTILEMVPRKKIVQEWKTSEWPEQYPPSILELTFTHYGESTEVTMVHSMVPASQAEEYKKGWDERYWKRLKKFFGEK